MYTIEDNHGDSLVAFLQQALNFLRYLLPCLDKPWEHFSHMLQETIPREINNQYESLRWLLETLFKVLNNNAKVPEQIQFAMEPTTTLSNTA